MAERSVHGDHDALELARLGVAPDTLIDFSVNVSPFGPHPAVVHAIHAARLDAYPDRHALDARCAIASSLDVDLGRVIVGNGAAELIWGAVVTLARPRGLLIVGPTFSEPLQAARAHDVRVFEVTMRTEDDFEVSEERIDHALRTHRPSLAYVCHPNNPTGSALPTTRLAALVNAHPSTCFLIDQAFLSLSDWHADSAVSFADNALVVRSLTKDHALAGVRVAYALAAPSLVERLERGRPPWSVSALALAAVRPCLANPEHVRMVRTELMAWRDALDSDLRSVGLRPVKSLTGFVLVKTGSADEVRRCLLTQHGIMVRSCTSFGLPDYLRLAARGAHERAQLIQALAAVLPR